MFNTRRAILNTIQIVAIASSTIFPLAAMAESQPSSTQENRESRQIANVGLPTNRRDGGSRGGCGTGDVSGFVAIIPETGVNFSASATPKLYFHVPESKQARTIELVLRDDSDRLVYEQFLTVSQKSGVMSVEIPLPITQKSSTEKAGYRWYLSNICNSKNRSQDIVLEGWIEHQPLSESEKQRLASFSDEEKLAFYQKRGFWHDSLELAAKDKEQWSQLLSEVGLASFSDKDLIE